MWKRALAMSVLIGGSLIIGGAAIAAIGSSPETATVTTVPEDTSTSMASEASTTMAAATTVTSAGVTSTTIATEATPTSEAPGAAAQSNTLYQAGDAGSVRVGVLDGSLVIEGVTPNEGWSDETEITTGREVEVKFLKGNRRVDFKAELEDGQVRIRVRDRLLDEDNGRADDSSGNADGNDRSGNDDNRADDRPFSDDGDDHDDEDHDDEDHDDEDHDDEDHDDEDHDDDHEDR